MDITPGEIGVMLVMAVTITAISIAYHERKAWLPWVVALWDRYVEVRWPASPDALRGYRTAPAPEAAPDAPGTSGAPRAHAGNDGAPGARTAPAPPTSDSALGDLLPLIQRIAGHKLRMPDDGKTATGQALGIPKSGSSERWKAFSRAWDLLYPPPVANIVPADHPEAFVEDGRGNLRSVRPAVR